MTTRLNEEENKRHMPKVEQATMQDVAAKQRAKLRKLLDERACMQFTFSFRKLIQVLEELGLDPDDARAAVSGCVLAASEEDGKKVKAEVNEEISAILSENSLTGIRELDPLGRKVDCLYYSSTSPARLVGDKMVEAAPSLGISVKKVLELIEAGTVPGKPYAVLTIREVKE